LRYNKADGFKIDHPSLTPS
jgi:hypothetical protein